MQIAAVKLLSATLPYVVFDFLMYKFFRYSEVAVNVLPDEILFFGEHPLTGKATVGAKVCSAGVPEVRPNYVIGCFKKYICHLFKCIFVCCTATVRGLLYGDRFKTATSHVNFFLWEEGVSPSPTPAFGKFLKQACPVLPVSVAAVSGKLYREPINSVE